jgi:voltage-gated sodium channel
MRRVNRTETFQNFVVLLIVANFVSDIVSVQLLPAKGTVADKALTSCYWVLTVFFAVELVFFNLFTSDSLAAFCADGWNIFDACVVIASLVCISVTSLPGLGLLRLLRVFRILRLMRSVSSLNKLLKAIQKSVSAVGGAFMLMFLICALSSIVAVDVFAEHSRQYFGTFGEAMFTMWMLLTFDNACSINALVVNAQRSGLQKFAVAFSIITVQLILGYILLNIVMAILLDEFAAASRVAKRSRAAAVARGAARAGADAPPANDALPLRPLLASLREASADAEDRRVRELFELIDEDESGSVDLGELAHGLLRLPFSPPIAVDEDALSDMAALAGLGRVERLSLGQFRHLLEHGARALEAEELDRAAGPGVALDDKLNAAMRTLRRALAAVRRLRGLELRAADMLRRLREVDSLDDSDWPPPPPPLPLPLFPPVAAHEAARAAAADTLVLEPYDELLEEEGG